MTRSDVPRPDHAPRFEEQPAKRPRFGRSRHSHGKPQHIYWHYGVSAMYVVATIGGALLVLQLLIPDISLAPAVRIGTFGCIAVSALSIGMILYGATPQSRRIRRWDVWLAFFLAVGVIGALGFVQYRARNLEKTNDPSEKSVIEQLDQRP